MPSFDFAAWLATTQERVEALLAQRHPEVVAGSPEALAKAMGYSLLAGGKRLRPVLTLAFADAVSASSTTSTVVGDAACATEMVHTYSLIHDDLPAMDDDDLRRGVPTNHRVHGEAMAILAGDALLTEAFGLLAKDVPGEGPVRARLCLELARGAGAGGMVGGQVLDIAVDRPAQKDYLVRLHALKTGALITSACRMGVLAAGGSREALDAAKVYGESVGLAFQIADDLLDVTASATAMGKPTGADAAAGRHTFPAVVGLEASRVLASEQVARAQAAIRRLEPTPGPLAALAQYAVERTR